MPLENLLWFLYFYNFRVLILICFVALVWEVATANMEPPRNPATTTRDNEQVQANDTVTETTPLLPGRVGDVEEGGTSPVDEERPATTDAPSLTTTRQPPFFNFLRYHRIILSIAILLALLLIPIHLIANLWAPPLYRLPWRLSETSPGVFFACLATIVWSVSNLVRHRRRPGTFLPLGVGALVHGIIGFYLFVVALDSTGDMGYDCSSWSGDDERLPACRDWARKFHVLVWTYLVVLHVFWITHGILFGGCLFATYKSRSLRTNGDESRGQSVIPAIVRRFEDILPASLGGRGALTLPDGPLRVEFTLNIQRQDGALPAGGDSAGTSGQGRATENSTITGVFNINGAST